MPFCYQALVHLYYCSSISLRLVFIINLDIIPARTRSLQFVLKYSRIYLLQHRFPFLRSFPFEVQLRAARMPAQASLYCHRQHSSYTRPPFLHAGNANRRRLPLAQAPRQCRRRYCRIWQDRRSRVHDNGEAFEHCARISTCSRLCLHAFILLWEFVARATWGTIASGLGFGQWIAFCAARADLEE